MEISQGSVVTLLRSGGTFSYSFIQKFTDKSLSERILIIGHHLAEL